MNDKKSAEERLKELYYNPKTGFLSFSKLWYRIKQEGIPLSQGDVKRFLEQQKPYELHKQVRRPTEFSNVYADYTLQCTQMDIMVYRRFEVHSYKYVIGVIDVYSRKVGCRAMTNYELETCMDNVKDIFENDFGGYPENMNTDNQFNRKAFIDFFTSKGTRLWFSLPDQKNTKNSLIERFWGTLAKILERAREVSTDVGGFNWPKALPDIVGNYNNELHRTLNATPNEVWEGEKKNPVERKVVETKLKKGMRVRIKYAKGVFEKGDVRTFSKEIYKIVEKKGKINALQNIESGEILKRLYHDDELDQTFDRPEVKAQREKREKVPPKPPSGETIAQRVARRRSSASLPKIIERDVVPQVNS